METYKIELKNFFRNQVDHILKEHINEENYSKKRNLIIHAVNQIIDQLLDNKKIIFNLLAQEVADILGNVIDFITKNGVENININLCSKKRMKN